MKNNKLSKSALKGIIKECLIEILAEGLSSTDTRSSSKRSSMLKEQIASVKESNFKKRSRTRMDSNFSDDTDVAELDQRRNEKLKNLAESITKDPILTEMLSDTAFTTLQEQISAENKNGYIPPGAGDDAQKQVASSNPESLFGADAASKWATLAFDS